MDNLEIININLLKDKERIGKGRFGIIYKAKYGTELVAIKEYKDKERTELIQNELKEMKNLPIHPNIIKFIGIIEKPIFYLIMEFIDGSNYLFIIFIYFFYLN